MEQQPEEEGNNHPFGEDAHMAEAPAPEDDHLHLGFVELFQPTQDPVFNTLQADKNNAEAIRLWAQFLAPGSSQVAASIPKTWADFFTAMLVNPAGFAWAKQLLSSSA